MQRRAFLTAAGAAALPIAGTTAQQPAKPESAQRQWLELRTYRVASPEKAKVLDTFLRDTAIPAYNRAGISAVGAFRSATDVPRKGRPLPLKEHDVMLLLPHASAESVAQLASTLAADDAYMRDGQAIHAAPTKDPVYRRVESWLMLAFDAVPTIEIPTKSSDRVFQLRVYESHNERAAARKREMFNDAGEIAVFRECGMNPVFFGQALAGVKLPNLIYMLGFDNMATQAAAWGKFGPHPTWKKLRSDPRFKGTVSNISNTFLRPTAYSQI